LTYVEIDKIEVGKIEIDKVFQSIPQKSETFCTVFCKKERTLKND
jgi:hypothetical protein